MESTLVTSIIDLAYLAAAILFIYGLKQLQSPATARAGNRLAAIGMLVAVVATLFLHKILNPVDLVIGLVVGGAIGVMLARRVEMTGMPELVALFNGLGGLASVLVAGAEVAKIASPGAGDVVSVVSVVTVLSIGISILIGMITFSGSLLAMGKLSGAVNGNPISFPGMRVLTLLIALASLGAMGNAALIVVGSDGVALADFFSGADLWSNPFIVTFIVLAAASLVLGILLVIPIGGADMPVVVALLNSYSGLAAAATGFVLMNTALIVSGALVGASGLILTNIMCVAMNRSLLNVLIGGFGGDDAASGGAAGGPQGNIQSTSAEDVAIMMAYADKVVIVPGYGMAVAQAQHQVRELADELGKNGVEVKYAIHPVAGRMPGHMNVLLAEANVPYDQLIEMDDINPEFDTTDVTLIIGANDVVNPAARHDTSSPIFGMPILDADKSKRTIVLKRSMRPGYSGVENELFFNDNNQMLFGDAKDSLTALVTEVKLLND
ncbi:MAG: NAD(P)(+) transhydrogenase (Re/Si-specific) subunit beta [Bacteroidetes bacterium]|nr:NAD(P)(+) transhydrogenase (Re/Si-specific) subunit beta [Bacteroidota bacterium]